MRAWVAVAVLLLSGCTGDGGEDKERVDVAEGTTDMQDGNGTGALDVQPDVPPPPRTLNLTGALQLVDAPAGQGRVSLNMGPADAFLGTSAPTLLASPVWPHALHVRSMTFEGLVASDVPTASAQLVDEVIAWVGVDGQFMATGFAPAPDVLLPDDAAPFSVDIEFDTGLIVPAGSKITLGLGTFYVDDGSLRNTYLLTGEPVGTRLTLDAQWVDLPAMAPPVPLATLDGEVAGSRCAGMDGGPESIDIPFEFPAGTAGLQAHLRLTASTGTGADDVDLHLYDASMRRIGHTTGPTGTETLTLHAPQLEDAVPGTWTARVVTCALQQARFEVALEAMHPA